MKLPRLLRSFIGAIALTAFVGSCLPNLEPTILGPAILNTNIANAQVIGSPNCTRVVLRSSPVDPVKANYGCTVLGSKEILQNATYTVGPNATHLLVESLIDGSKTVGYFDLRDGQPWGNEFGRTAGSGVVVELQCDSRTQFFNDFAERGTSATDYEFTLNVRGMQPVNRYTEGNIADCRHLSSSGEVTGDYKGPMIGVYDASPCGIWVSVFPNKPSLLPGFGNGKMKFESTCTAREGAINIARYVRDGAQFFPPSFFAKPEPMFLPYAAQPVIRPRIPQPAQ